MKPDFSNPGLRENAGSQNLQILGRIKNLRTQLAGCPEQIRECQRLRYQVFYEEMSATADSGVDTSHMDADEFDAYCDHLLVLDQASGTDEIVGAYRLLTQEKAIETGGFYSSTRFDVNELVKRHGGKAFLEFGRSFVLPPYRNKRTIELLWQGSWAYVRQNGIDVMFGCASFEGTNPDKFVQALSYLYHQTRAKDEWRIRAKPGFATALNRIAADEIDTRMALSQLPPLIKGYLRLGAMIGEDAVIDQQFGTIDVMIILPITHLNPRYVNHYGQNAERFRSTR